MAAATVDLEDLVKKWAWQMFDITKTKEQSKIPRDCLMMTISWKKVRFVHTKPEYDETQKPASPKSQCLFRTFFSNNTDQTQQYSFKTERVTRSCCDVVIEKGYTFSEEMSIKLATPCEVFEANVGFQRELSLTDIQGQTFEEEMTWGVDSQITVPAKQKTTAQLMIAEDQFSGNFTVKTTFSGKVHVTITNIKDNNSFLKSIDGNIAEIIRREMEEGLRDFTVDKNVVSYITKGKCNFRFAIEQHVKLSQEPIIEEQPTE